MLKDAVFSSLQQIITKNSEVIYAYREKINKNFIYLKSLYNFATSIKMSNILNLKKLLNGNKTALTKTRTQALCVFHIVVADSRAPRDGKFRERIGSYNPNTHPATITLNFDRALYWLQTGAQPTHTVRNILSREGVLLKKHLLGGWQKGAFSEEEAEKKIPGVEENKQKTLDSLKQKMKKNCVPMKKPASKREKDKRRERAKALAKKKPKWEAAYAP